MNPYISFVVTARNDDYGGNWINRINAFIKVLTYQAERTKLSIELVFVEYNPVPNKINLYKELNVPKNEYLKIRFIVVPSGFHDKLPNHDKVVICEFISKNIGARRARGEYILGTNPDVLFGNDLFDFLSQKKLQNDTFYRINRSDLSTGYIESGISAEQILSNSKNKVTKIMFNNQTVYVSFTTWLSTFIHGRNMKIFFQCPLFNIWRRPQIDSSIIHENAAGDFLLMHKSLWEKVRGYDEMTVGSGVMDGYIMYSLYCLGVKQSILPYSLFHINHHRGGVRYLASHTKFREDANKMLRTKELYKVNSPDWGFPNMNFEEISI